jgi:hypothetical protein
MIPPGALYRQRKSPVRASIAEKYPSQVPTKTIFRQTEGAA